MFYEAIIGGFLYLITTIYGLITFPFYFFYQKPWQTIREHKKPKAIVLSETEGITYRSITPISSMHNELNRHRIDTMDKVFQFAMRNGLKKCLGSREILSEENETQPDGKMFKKYVLGRYVWKSYKDVDLWALRFGKGLRELGLEPTNRMAILAETRAEWLIAAIAAFRQNFTIVTLYATLGDAGIIHGLNETEVSFVLTSHEQLPKFKNVLQQTPNVKTVIYMKDPMAKTDTSGFREDIEIISFCDVMKKGDSSEKSTSAPSPNDTAIIMYTSGSTGVPKGVLLSHRNISTTMKAFSDGMGPVYPDDVYIGYLPLAHVFELVCEAICFLQGIPIGYSSALTLLDVSSKVKRGCKGDASELRPTFMPSVPLVLTRIYKGVQEKVDNAGKWRRTLFKFFYNYKLKWYYRGYVTPLTDRLIFKSVKMVLGGRIRLLACGGAPLTPDVHEFMRTCLCVPLQQGYGLTETNACATISLRGDMSLGRVGALLECNDIRLVNWEEGNYSILDKPYPRGEILIGGDNVAVGYFNLPDATNSAFFDEDGRRWFRSGDIGEMQEDGVLKIIDRKKDLVKLQYGEYVSLGKIEAEMKTCPIVDNICVYGDPSRVFCVALIVPNPQQLEATAAKLGRRGSSLEMLCEDPEVATAVLKDIQSHGSKCKLQKFEIPGAVKLCQEVWTPDMGLVTAAFKLKRKNILVRYQEDINKMYAL